MVGKQTTPAGICSKLSKLFFNQNGSKKQGWQCSSQAFASARPSKANQAGQWEAQQA